MNSVKTIIRQILMLSNGNKNMTNLYDKDTALIFTDALKCFIKDKPYKSEISENDLKKVFSLAEIHDLSPILYYTLKDNESFIASNIPIKTELKKKYRYAIFRSSQNDDYIKLIEEEFKKGNIKIIFFKGAQLKKYYPVAELRTMGDIDCLINETDRESAHKIMCNLGYINSAKSLDVWEYNKGKMHIEMQSCLAHNGIGNGFDYTSYFSDAFDHTVADNHRLRLENEYYLCYLIYHIAKHLSSTGAGIRMIMDIAVFTNHFEPVIDKEKFCKILEETKLKGTANAVFALCDKWFNTDFIQKFGFDGDIPEGLEEYIINGGTFGFKTHDTGDIYRRKALEPDKENSKLSYRMQVLKDFFFPSADYLTRYLPALKKHRYLLPLAWLIRIFVGVFKHGKHSVYTLNSIKSGDDDRTFKEAEMLRKMGI